jgi:acetyl-CoA acetyltransferase family protein
LTVFYLSIPLLVIIGDTVVSEVVIVDGVRTPFCKAGGVFKDLPAYELGKIAVRELLERLEFSRAAVDQVILGNIGQPLEAINIARISALKAGIPESVPAFTVQRNCGSGLQSFVSAYHEISVGNAATIIAGGVESMSNYPALFPKAFAHWFQLYQRAKTKPAKVNLLRKFRFSYLKPIVSLQMALTDYMIETNMAQTADVLAKEYRISRKEQDQFALLSHQRAARATATGILKEEIVPVIALPDYHIVVEEDDGIRKEQTAEQLANLPPLYEPYGTVTAGNASQISDGAAVLLMMSADRARELGYEPLAQVRSYGFAALNPAAMGIAPAYATARALQKAKMKYADIQLTEINEAFASVVIANERLFANKRFVTDTFGRADILSPINREKLNVNGGAIAIGHPVGASAARIVLTLLKEMQRCNAVTGLATMCIGGGQGGAIILERK